MLALPTPLICIVCPLCGWTSHNHDDVRHKYCGRCRVFHADIPRDAMASAVAKRASLADQIIAQFRIPRA